MELEHGQTAYHARFAGDVLGPHGAADAWADLPDDARAVWRRVEDAVTERAVNGAWRLLISSEEAKPLDVVRIASEPLERPVGLSLGFGRGLQPEVVRHVEEFLRDIPRDLVIIGDQEPILDITLGPVGQEHLEMMVEEIIRTVSAEDEPAPIAPAETATSARAKGFSGNMCQSCGSLQMIRSGTCETCQSCGTTGGCG